MHLNVMVSVWSHPGFLARLAAYTVVVFSWPVLNFYACVVLGVAVVIIVTVDIGWHSIQCWRFRAVGGCWIAGPVHHMV